MERKDCFDFNGLSVQDFGESLAYTLQRIIRKGKSLGKRDRLYKTQHLVDHCNESRSRAWTLEGFPKSGTRESAQSKKFEVLYGVFHARGLYTM